MPLLPQAIAFSQTKRCLQVYSDLHGLHSLFRSTSGREGWKFSKAWGGSNKKTSDLSQTANTAAHRSHALEGHPIDSETSATSVVKLASQSSSSQGYKHEQAVLVDLRKVAAFRQPKWVPAKPGKDWWGTMSHVHVLKTKKLTVFSFRKRLGSPWHRGHWLHPSNLPKALHQQRFLGQGDQLERCSAKDEQNEQNEYSE